jgi:broad specificity phosphatase PhoE
LNKNRVQQLSLQHVRNMQIGNIMRLIFIRHGDPDYENDTLTEKGWREATLLAKRTAEWKVEKFYCSPLGRARDTASLTLKAHERQAEVQDWLKEITVPLIHPVTGKNCIPWDQFPSYWTNEPDFLDKDQWLNTELMKSGEMKQRFSETCTGMDQLLSEHGYQRKNGYYLAEKSNGDTLVFFCHLGVMLAIMGHLLNVSPMVLWHGFCVLPTSVTVLNSEERIDKEAYFRCQLLGDTTHLHDGGERISKAGSFAEIFQD